MIFNIFFHFNGFGALSFLLHNYFIKFFGICTFFRLNTSHQSHYSAHFCLIIIRMHLILFLSLLQTDLIHLTFAKYTHNNIEFGSFSLWNMKHGTLHGTQCTVNKCLKYLLKNRYEYQTPNTEHRGTCKIRNSNKYSRK